MDALGLTFPIATVISLIAGTVTIVWKLAKYSSKVDALHIRVDEMVKDKDNCPQIAEHERRLAQHDMDIKEIKDIIQKDQVERATWRAETTAEINKQSSIQTEIKEGLKHISDMFTQFIAKQKG